MKPIKRTKKLPLLPVLAGAVILIPFLLFTGCTGQVPGPRLEGTGWTLTGYLHNGTLVPPVPGTIITMDFDAKDKVSGSAGCNHYFASYEVKGTGITIGQAGSTMMYCSSPGVMDQESSYLALLARSKTLRVEGDRLTLSGEQGDPVLTFVKTIPPKQQPLAGTNWTLESFHTGDAVSSVLAGTTITAVFTRDGSISGSAGCNQYFASYTLSGTSLQISQVGSTKMACGAPGVMQQESSYLALISQAKTFAINGDRLTLADAKDAAILTFRASDQPS